MLLEVLGGEFCICKIADISAVNLDAPWLFVGKTDSELSVVCLVEHAPMEDIARENGWCAFRVAGQMDFGLTGVLAGLAAVLARADISIFALSTFDTDYILVKEKKLTMALKALKLAGYEVGRTILPSKK